MTPAVNVVKKAKIPYQIREYKHDPNSQSFGKEAAKKLNLAPERVFKTLVVLVDQDYLVVAVVPVSEMLNLKRFAKVAGGKKANMAEKSMVERTTGYILGGVSPLGQKKRLKTIIDGSAKNFETIFVSGGKRGLDIELSPQDLCTLTNGIFENIGA